MKYLGKDYKLVESKSTASCLECDLLESCKSQSYEFMQLVKGSEDNCLTLVNSNKCYKEVKK